MVGINKIGNGNLEETQKSSKSFEKKWVCGRKFMPRYSK